MKNIITIMMLLCACNIHAQLLGSVKPVTGVNGIFLQTPLDTLVTDPYALDTVHIESFGAAGDGKWFYNDLL